MKRVRASRVRSILAAATHAGTKPDSATFRPQGQSSAQGGSPSWAFYFRAYRSSPSASASPALSCAGDGEDGVELQILIGMHPDMHVGEITLHAHVKRLNRGWKRIRFQDALDPASMRIEVI